MSFIETPRFPEDISFGAIGGPNFSTTVVTLNSGHEQRNQNWSAARLRYNVAHAARTQSQMNTVIAFFRAMKGRTHSFRYKDWADYICASDEGLLGTGVGTGAASYQLVKNYPAGALYEYRDIKKPVASTVNIYKNGVLQTLTTQYSLDSTTGIVTFVALGGSPTYPTGADAITWSGEFDVPCRFDTDELAIEILDKKADGTLLLGWQSVPIVEIRI